MVIMLVVIVGMMMVTKMEMMVVVMVAMTRATFGSIQPALQAFDEQPDQS